MAAVSDGTYIEVVVVKDGQETTVRLPVRDIFGDHLEGIALAALVPKP